MESARGGGVEDVRNTDDEVVVTTSYVQWWDEGGCVLAEVGKPSVIELSKVVNQITNPKTSMGDCDRALVKQ